MYCGYNYKNNCVNNCACVIPGPPGAPGPAGATGPQGPAGTSPITAYGGLYSCDGCLISIVLQDDWNTEISSLINEEMPRQNVDYIVPELPPDEARIIIVQPGDYDVSYSLNYGFNGIYYPTPVDYATEFCVLKNGQPLEGSVEHARGYSQYPGWEYINFTSSVINTLSAGDELTLAYRNTAPPVASTYPNFFMDLKLRVVRIGPSA
jgi:hypothetical protein